MMRFKYEEHLKKLTDCPPSSYTSQTLKSYRFVFASPNHPHNFLPALLKDPKRVFKIKNPVTQCQGYGLSLYNNKVNAIDYAEARPEIAIRLGTHLAEGIIESTDGVISLANAQGHFTLHEFEGIDLSHKFQIIQELYYVKND